MRDRPEWQQAPDDVRERFQRDMPKEPRNLGDVLAEFKSSIAPYSTGNGHPLFMGWVHGAGTPVGMVAEMLAAGLNANCGGRNHIGITVEQQITRWAAELFGFPDDSSGLFVTGTSAANSLGLQIARMASLGRDFKTKGLREFAQLTAYASAQVHGCVIQAAETSGLGSDHLRLIPVNDAGAMRLDLLAQAIADDRQSGLRPFLVVGTAGGRSTPARSTASAISLRCAAGRSSGFMSMVHSARCVRCRPRCGRSCPASSTPIPSRSTSTSGRA